MSDGASKQVRSWPLLHSVFQWLHHHWKQLIRHTLMASIALVAICIMTGVTLLVVFMWKVRSVEADFTKVKLGMTEEQVVEVMGSPKIVRAENSEMPLQKWVPQNVDLLEHRAGANEVKQLIYLVRTPYLPIRWIVGLNSDGFVVTKFKFL